MQADPQRQWFVYHNEKEMGPYNEDDVKKKLAAGELTQSAYLFTEGMADWALVEDVDVFRIKQSAATVTPLAKAREEASEAAAFSASQNDFTNTSTPGQVTNTGVRTTDDPTLRGGTQWSHPQSTQTRTRVPDRPASTRKRILTALLALLVVALGYLIYQDQKNAPKPEEVTKQVETSPSTATHMAPGSGGAAADVDWKSLQEHRDSTDPNIQPFRIAEGRLGGDHPIVVGVLSQMIKADRIYASVYSDNEKSLSAIPRIWFVDAPVLEGYFTLGPFSQEGKALPPGTYHVAVAANGNFLGEVSFAQGPWPSETEVGEIQKKVLGERSQLAEKEIASLNEKLQEMTAAYAQLEVIGRIAQSGPRKAAEWKNKSQAWRKILRGALEDQRSVLAGPMFYGEAQSQLYNFMSSLMKHFEALDIQAKEGPAFLVKVKGKALPALWTQLKTEKEELAVNLQAALKNPPGTLKIDPEVVKNRLVEVSK